MENEQRQRNQAREANHRRRDHLGVQLGFLEGWIGLFVLRLCFCWRFKVRKSGLATRWTAKQEYVL